ncbi:MAG: urease accessory protein UreF [Hyphomicrobiales bacterium]|nr:urease accessory protein UreF [Hyphomicrobiales bacterium]MDE2114660.1 urease accessory protein UreF [Hyphomicrobiales bacterium]
MKPPDPAHLLQLLTWLSPAFPTGGFAYSNGLEWAVEAGDITDESGLGDWISDLLRHGSLWSDAIIMRKACRAPPSQWQELAEMALALCPSHERRLETLAQGAAFRLAAAPWPCPALEGWAQTPLPYPVAVGLLAGAHDMVEDQALVAFLHAATANLVSAGVRLIPLGQTSGLRIQRRIESEILRMVEGTQNATLDDCGGLAWRSEIASMNHETQTTRLFRS